MTTARMVNYYDVLKVSRDADTTTIREAYKKLALALHPDKNDKAEEEKYTALFAELQNAQATLVDPIQRAEYDRTLSDLPKQPTAASKGIMIFGARDARVTAMHNVQDALDKIIRFFKLNENPNCVITVTDDQSAIARQFERSAKGMITNVYERFGIEGAPIVIVEFSISAKEVNQLRSAIIESSRPGKTSIDVPNDALDKLLSKLIDAISSIQISTKLIRTKEENDIYSSNNVYDPISKMNFLLFTRADLMDIGLISEQKTIAQPMSQPSLINRMVNFFKRSKPTTKEIKTSPVLAIKGNNDDDDNDKTNKKSL